MKVMLLCYDDEAAWKAKGPAALPQAMREAVALTHELDAKGQYVMASPLHAASTAKTVKVRDGKSIVTDGPYAETREVLGGFYLLDVNSIDEAVQIAAKHPGARICAVEARPIMELPGVPDPKI